MDENEKKKFMRRSSIYDKMDKNKKRELIKIYIDEIDLATALYFEDEKKFHYCENCGAYSEEILDICYECGTKIKNKEKNTKRINQTKELILKSILRIGEIDADEGIKAIGIIMKLLAKSFQDNRNFKNIKKQSQALAKYYENSQKAVKINDVNSKENNLKQLGDDKK